MKCHLCGQWMTPIMNGPLTYWCSPCGMKQLPDKPGEQRQVDLVRRRIESLTDPLFQGAESA